MSIMNDEEKKEVEKLIHFTTQMRKYFCKSLCDGAYKDTQAIAERLLDKTNDSIETVEELIRK